MQVEIISRDITYLALLARQYPTIQAASTEIIHLSSMLELPKGTEHFISDVHGEYESFIHVLRNGSGSIKRKIGEIFASTLMEKEMRSLAALIYYPEQKIPLVIKKINDPDEWYRITLFRLVKICRVVSSKYTHEQVREAMPEAYANIIEELLHEQENTANKLEYYNRIVDSIIATGQAREFVIEIAKLIQRFSIAKLHILGDVYDRGPGAHIIMDTLINYHSVDFQWGNHDILWMGAAAGSEACMANVIRICLRYSNMGTLEEGYGISILPLATFATETYRDDPCRQFLPQMTEDEYTENEQMMMARMHKAITIIQLKLEAQIICRHSEFEMDDRLLLDKMDLENGTVQVAGETYALNDTNFPTFNPESPFKLSEEEQFVVDRLMLSFGNSEKLQSHTRLLYSKGGMYQVYNGNLLYHGCIVMNQDGSFKKVQLKDQEYSPREYMDRFDQLVRQAYFATNDPDQKQYGMDTMWYLWSGPNSPLFGKDRMATFERYFIDDKTTHREVMDAYYDFRDEEETSCRILQEFGLNPEENAHIINGHVPVKVKKGESPVKAGGKLLVIDGGFSKAYQSKTGIAGYTLIFNSYGFLLTEHPPFQSAQHVIEEEEDLDSKTEILETSYNRMRVKDTDEGRQIRERIDELTQLLEAYRKGLIKESSQ